MRSVRRSARVRYSASQMFKLVDDIARYPEFLSWCQRATIQRRTRDLVEATLEVGLGGVRKQFSTRNRLDEPRRIAIELLKGPFKSLEGAWTFNDHDDGGSEVSLALDFEVSHTPLNMLFAVLFEEVVRAQIAAFIARAEALYG
ncbi:MAG: type II toxin-antitoxin system RatA family toxin [Gammaproteobacteria bacterium]